MEPRSGYRCAALYSVLLAALPRMTGLEWQPTYSKTRVKYITQPKLGVCIYPYRRRPYERHISPTSVHLPVVLWSPSGFRTRAEWVDSLLLEVKHGLLDLLRPVHSAQTLVAHIARWRCTTLAAPVYIQWREGATLDSTYVEDCLYSRLCERPWAIPAVRVSARLKA